MSRRTFCIVYMTPAVLAVIGALGHLPSWFYTMLKVLFVIDALFHAWTIRGMLKLPGEGSNPFMLLLTVPVFAGVIAICSMLIPGGLPKGLWIFVDILYAIVKLVLIGMFNAGR